MEGSPIGACARAAVLVTTVVVALGCKEKDPIYPAPGAPMAPTYSMPPPGAPMPAPTTVPAAAAPAPTATASLPAALGFFCASDSDAQCPYGHCLGGRCGGCTDASQCKANAQCFPTWFGNACLPAVAQQTPAPVPPPRPATAPAPTPVAVPVPNAPAAIPAATPPATASSGGPVERARTRCVTRLNEYRARVGAAALRAQSDRAPCADAQARSDAGTRTAHGAFGQCRENAQNECPAWSGSLEDTVDRCLAMMFAEGPGGGHYENMTDPKARSAVCGVFTASSGELWMVQDFFR